MVRVSAEISSPSTPVKAAPAALACRLVQLRAAAAVWPGSGVGGTSLSSAKPKATPVNSRPSASSVPPLTPANARRFDAPTFSACACAVLPSDSVSATGAAALSKAKSPSTCTKPNTSSATRPSARSSSPRVPSMDRSSSLAGPVSTLSCVAPAP